MATTRQLRDLYQFPGFEPLAGIHGVFGDPLAVVLTLQRRRKKRRAGYVGKHRQPFTTNGRAGFATCRVATSASISISLFGACSVRGAPP